jgi:WD40 repeat protein
MNQAIFTEDGAGLVTADGSMTNNVRLWDLATETTVRTFGEHVGNVFALCLLANGRLATGGDDRRVRVWDLASGQRLQMFNGSTQIVNSLFAATGGTNLFAGYSDGRVVHWDVGTGSIIQEVKDNSLATACRVPGANQLLLATASNELHLWDLATSSIIRDLPGHTTSTITGVSFSPDGRFVLSGGVEKFTRLWDRTNGLPVRTFVGHGAGTACAAFSADGTKVLTTAGAPQAAAQIWNTATGVMERQLLGHTGWPLAAVFSRDGQRVATSALDKTVRIFDAATGTSIRTLFLSLAPVHSLAFSPDGTLIAGGSSSFDPAIRVWNIQSGQIIHTFQENAGTVKAVAFSPDGTSLMGGWEDGLVRIFDLASGSVKRELLPFGLLSAAVFSPDGQFVLTAEGWPMFSARLWDASSGELLRVLVGHTAPVESVAFNARGTQVLTGSDIVRLWDISDIVSRISVTRGPNTMTLRWDVGSLEQAPSPGGPWTPMPQATSPWTNVIEPGAAFFRVVNMPD